MVAPWGLLLLCLGSVAVAWGLPYASSAPLELIELSRGVEQQEGAGLFIQQQPANQVNAPVGRSGLVDSIKAAFSKAPVALDSTAKHDQVTVEQRVKQDQITASHVVMVTDQLKAQVAELGRQAYDHTAWDMIVESIKELEMPLKTAHKLQEQTVVDAKKLEKESQGVLATQKFASQVIKEHTHAEKLTDKMALMALTSRKVAEDVQKVIVHQESAELGESKSAVDPLTELSDAQKALQNEMRQVEQKTTASGDEENGHDENVAIVDGTNPRRIHVKSLSASTTSEDVGQSLNLLGNNTRPPLNPNATSADKTLGAQLAPQLQMVAQTKKPPTLQPTSAPARAVNTPAPQVSSPKLPFIPANRDATGAPHEQSHHHDLDMPKVKKGLETSFSRMSTMAQKLANEDAQQLKSILPDENE